jgi:DUF4097 and DUF4098 domain-containing protein YvlB
MRHCIWLSAPVRSIALGMMVAVALSAWPAVEGSFERTLTVDGNVELEIQTGSGSVDVRAGTGNTVRVRGIIRAGGNLFSNYGDAQERVRQIENNPPVQQAGNAIRLGRTSDPELLRNVSISYEVTAPPNTRVRSSTGSGSQKVEGIRGPIEVKTGSGGIRVTGSAEAVEARTGSGSIEVTGAAGLRAQTGSGGIRAADVRGPVKANTGSGSINLNQTGQGDVEAETGSGGVEIKGAQEGLRVSTSSGSVRVEGDPRSHWRIRASSGGVRIRVPQNAAFDVNARTGSGGIRVSHTLSETKSSSKRHLQAKIGGGGPMVDVSTTSGGIQIEH